MWPIKKPAKGVLSPSSPGTVTPPAQDARLQGDRSLLRSVDGRARLGKSLSFQGELKGAEDLHLDGEFEGTIELGDHKLVVGPQGRVRASIRAREIVVEGKVQGSLTARERLQISRTGSVTGDLLTARIIIEDGAYFKGSIDIERAEEKPARGEAVAAETFRVAAAPLAVDPQDKLQ